MPSDGTSERGVEPECWALNDRRHLILAKCSTRVEVTEDLLNAAAETPPETVEEEDDDVDSHIHDDEEE